MEDRYQYQRWYVKLWRRRHYLRIPFVAAGIFIRWRGPEKGLRRWESCWSIATGLAQVKMKWYYDWEEVRSRIKGTLDGLQ